MTIWWGWITALWRSRGKRTRYSTGSGWQQGPGELLTPETRGLFLGWEQSALGFTALTDRPQEAEALLGQEARYRRPTIEELIIYRGGNVQ